MSISRYRRVAVDQIVVAYTAATTAYTLHKIVSFDTSGAHIEDLIPDPTSTTSSTTRTWQDLYYIVPMSASKTSGSDVYALYDVGAGLAPDWSSVYYHVIVSKRSKVGVTVLYDGETQEKTIPLSVTFQTGVDPITVPAVILPECIAGSKALEETLAAVQQKRIPSSRAQLEALAAAAPQVGEKRRRDDTGDVGGQTKHIKLEPTPIPSVTPLPTAPATTAPAAPIPTPSPAPVPKRIRIPLPPPRRTVEQAMLVLPAACTPLTDEDRKIMAESRSLKTASSTYTSLLGCQHPYDGIVIFEYKNITAAPYVMDFYS